MNVNDFIKVLEEENGNSLYDVFVPSKNSTLKFRYLTVAEIKSISKMVLNEGDDEYIALCSMIIKSCASPLTLDDFTDFDRIALLIGIRANNFPDEKYTISCPKCKTEFTTVLNYNNLLEKLKPIETKELEVKKDAIKYKFIIGDPSVKKVIEFKESIKIFIELEKENEDHSETVEEELGDFISDYSSFIFIKELYINDEILEGYNELSFMDKFKLFSNFPTIVYDKLSKKTEELDNNLSEILNEQIVCINPDCKHTESFFVDIEDFFMN